MGHLVLNYQVNWNSPKLPSYFISFSETYFRLLFQIQTSDCSHCILSKSSLGYEICTWWMAWDLWWWHWGPWTSWKNRWAAHAPRDRKKEKGNEAVWPCRFLETVPSKTEDQGSAYQKYWWKKCKGFHNLAFNWSALHICCVSDLEIYQ